MSQVLSDSLEADVGMSAIGAADTGNILSSLLKTDVFDSSLAAAANLTGLLELASANQLCVFFTFLSPSDFFHPFEFSCNSCETMERDSVLGVICYLFYFVLGLRTIHINPSTHPSLLLQ